MKEKKN